MGGWCLLPMGSIEGKVLTWLEQNLNLHGQPALPSKPPEPFAETHKNDSRDGN